MITAKLDPAKFDDLAEKLRAEEGIELTGAVGVIEKNGIRVTWSYDGETLMIDIVQHPLIPGKAFYEGRLRDALAAQGVVLSP